MADPNITVNPQNSPYPIPAGTVNYGTVTFQPGGFMQLEAQSNLTMQVVNKTTATKVSQPYTQKR